MTTGQDMFAEDPRPARPLEDDLVVELAGYEGPIGVLLELARDQKVDLSQISILELAEQYLAFVQRARKLNLELAADYLVMAAWLAYLKSRLLLPDLSEDEEEPSATEMAAALAFQLRRLQAMQEAGGRLLDRPQLGHAFFPRGAPEGLPVVRTVAWDATLYDLLTAYARHRARIEAKAYRPRPLEVVAIEAALERLRTMVGRLPDWSTLFSFLPIEGAGGQRLRSAMASTFAASLELTRTGRIELRQDGAFKPIYVRSRPVDEGADDDDAGGDPGDGSG